MGWWIGGILVWLLSFAWIVYCMREVSRGKISNIKMAPGYLFHGATAVLALWMVLKAMGYWAKRHTS